MIYNFIALGIIAAALAAITYVLARKYNQLKIIDVATIAAEKQSQVKERILIDRLRRRAQQSTAMVARAIKPSGAKAKSFFSKLADKFSALERKYQRESKRQSKPYDAEFEEKIQGLIAEAEDYLKREDWPEAEKKYIEVVSLDAENKHAYQGLANLYLKQKEYQQAIQTIKYLIKLEIKKCKLSGAKLTGQPGDKSCPNAPELSECYIKLGEVYREMNNPQQALNWLQQACRYTPNDPKVLDFLIQTYIGLKDRTGALEHFRKLQQVNPDNQKLVEYRKQLDEM